MNSETLCNRLRENGINPRQAIVSGSASIAVQYEDFREPSDIDLVLSVRQFVSLLFNRHWKLVLPGTGRPILEIRLVSSDNCEAFLCWKSGTQYLSYHTLTKTCVPVADIFVAPIATVKKYKRALRREKDIFDLAFLHRHDVR
jgi:hypothetical protein